MTEKNIYSYEEAFEKCIEYFGGEDLPAKVFLDKYALRDGDGNILEDTPDKMHRRLAKEFARIEEKYPDPMSEDEIFSLIDKFEYIIPQGSPMSAIGNPYHVQSSGNCFSIEPPYDSYGGICYSDQQLVQLMKRRCVEENSIVNIKNKGLLPIKDVSSGDDILSFNTKDKITEYKKVNKVFCTKVKKKDRVEIKFSNGSILKTSKKHPILILEEEGYRYKKCGELKEKDVCIQPSKGQYDYLSFEDNLSDIAWYIGCHIGDGSVGKLKNGNLRLRNTGDNELVIKKYAEITNLLTGSKANYRRSTRKDYKTQCWEYSNNKKSLFGVVSKYFDNMIGKKTYSCFVPDFIKDNNLWIPFISGLVDADGYIRDYGTIDISICSKKLIDEISSFLSAAGISHHSSIKNPKRENEKTLYRVQIHSNRDIINIFSKYMFHDKKKEKIKNAICREFSHKKFLTKVEKKLILERYNQILYPTNRYSDVKISIKERGSRNNLSSIISLFKKDTNIGIGALNSFLKYDLISQEKYNEINQRVFVKSISNDIESKKYIDIEVEGNNNFYAGNFGMINIHNCGVGMALNTIRPKGLLVNNAAKTTDGISIFMERYSNTCREVAQNSRRGALILLLNIRHPEIKTFINIKNDKKKVTGANISIQITDDFIEAMKRNDEFELRWPVDSDNPSIRQKVSAKEIWDNFIESSWKSADPGVLFWDTVIKYSVSNNYGKIDKTFYDTSCNPCITGDTLVLTDKGQINISDIIKKGVDKYKVATYNIDKDLIEFENIIFGDKTRKDADVIEIELEDGEKIQLTPDHKVYTKNRGYIEASFLNEDDIILKIKNK